MLCLFLEVNAVKNLIFVPFAFNDSKQTGVNVKSQNAFIVYLKNICVALISAKRFNPNIDVALVCNFYPPNPYRNILLDNNILIIQEDFDSYIFDNDYKWGLAFYKLCALEKMIQKHKYDNYVYMDADVIIQNSLDLVFEELQNNILLYDINHGLSVPHYREIIQEFQTFGISSYITHYGGEFFGASFENAKIFISFCKKIYEKMKERNLVTTKGDEFIISIAANQCRLIVKNAGGYIFRFWTGSFYLVSTCYKYNPVCILHLPDGKNTSIVKIFNKYIIKNRFPSIPQIHKICHLKKQSLKSRIKRAIYSILKK